MTIMTCMKRNIKYALAGHGLQVISRLDNAKAIGIPGRRETHDTPITTLQYKHGSNMCEKGPENHSYCDGHQ